MVVCPNCNHQNPDGAIQCEACYTPLPTMASCPNCGASVQSDASFCGQCGFNLKAAPGPTASTMTAATVAPDFEIPDLVEPDPLVVPDPIEVVTSESSATETPVVTESDPVSTVPPPPPAVPPTAPTAAPPAPAPTASSATQLQIQRASLLHVQTNTTIELPQTLTVIHIGKQNDRIPPDVDVSGFPNSEIVSRIHADIRLEGDTYFLEDVGSSNGTYVNNLPLPMGNRHRLRPGDRIALGKGDKMTFLFQVS